MLKIFNTFLLTIGVSEPELLATIRFIIPKIIRIIPYRMKNFPKCKFKCEIRNQKKYTFLSGIKSTLSSIVFSNLTRLIPSISRYNPIDRSKKVTKPSLKKILIISIKISV